MWPAYLRRAGYYTSNNAKKDYNVVEGAVWDEWSNQATWRKRSEPDTPFFHMQTIGLSHEGSLHFRGEVMRRGSTVTDPSKVELAPYHPDTPTFRYTYARYFDRMRLVDGEVGKIVAELEEDGLLEDTFIFYFGDHGGVLPRSKGYIYESGLHVPLVVRIPANWKHLVDHERGARVDGFVSFIDFGPTVLNLAGLEISKQMDGRPFLGKGVGAEELAGRDEAFSYADRFDEKYDLVRSLRKGRFKYIRNYQAFYPDALQNNYRYNMLAYQEWRRLFREGKLDDRQSQFFERRAPEQLFDVVADPHEVGNLAGDPKYAPVLEDLRERLRQRVKGINDLSFYPESYLVEHALPDGAAFGRAHSGEIARLVDIADLALEPFAEARVGLEAAVSSGNPWERYWGLIACTVFGEEARGFAPQARRLLDDPNAMVRVRAAEFLGSVRATDPMPALYDVLNASESPVELLLTFQTVVHLRDMKDGYPFDVDKLNLKMTKGEFNRRLEYLAGK